MSITSDKLKSIFSVFVGSRTVDETASVQGDLPYREVESICCVTNLIGFDALCTSGDSQQIERVLNGYYARMADAVLESDGELNKFAGAMTVSFYVPGHTTRDEQALITKLVSVLDRARATVESELAVLVGVGVCVGSLVYGRFGSPDRATVTGFGRPLICATRLADRGSGINLCEGLAESCSWEGPSNSISVHAHAGDS